MKNVVLSLLSVASLLACSSIDESSLEPINVFDAAQLITSNTDDEHIGMQTKLVRHEFFDNAAYKYRAILDKNNQPELLQLYVNLGLKSWCHIYNAKIPNQNSTLTLIERKEKKGANHISVHEEMAINISKETLKNLTMQDTLIKLEGTKCDYIFSVNKHLSQAFYNEIHINSI